MSQTTQVSAVNPQRRIYGICSDVSHSTDACPTQQEDNFNDHIVATVRAFPTRPQ